MKKQILIALAVSVLTVSTGASAADEPSSTTRERPGAGEKGVFVTAKIGGIVPFGGLGPNAIGGIDLGYALDNGLAFGIGADYAAPKKSESERDTRVSGGTYTWHLTQQMLQVMPFIMYRIKSLGTLVPYVAIGPRIYMLQSFVRSNEGKPEFQETREASTKIGVGVPIGIELKAGPGALIGELLLQYGGLDHTSTGKSNSGAASLSLGYRMMF